MNGDHPIWANISLMFAAFCGSVTSLSMMQWKSMEPREIALTLFVGTTFSIFVAPFVATKFFGIDGEGLRPMCAAMYFGATGANTFLPFLIKRLIRNAGGE